MPYLHCPHCRLTIHATGVDPEPDARCPRCDALLSLRPGRLFGTGSVPSRMKFTSTSPRVRSPSAK